MQQRLEAGRGTRRPEDLDRVELAQTVDERVHRGHVSPHLGERTEGRIPELPAAGALGLGDHRRIGPPRRFEDLMIGQAGLHQQPAVAGPGPDPARRAGQERECLLRGAVARREELLVEVQERGEQHRWAGRQPVQHRLRADEDLPAAHHLGRRIDFDDLDPRQERRQVFPHPRHPEPQPLEPSRMAMQADDRTLEPATRAPQRAVLRLLDERAAPLAPGELVAGHAREEPRPAAAIQEAHRAPALVHRPVQGSGERPGEQPGSGWLLARIDDLDDRPPGPFDRAVGPNRRAGDRLGLERRCRADQGDRRVRAPCALDRDIARVPGRGALLLQCLVTLVEHDDRGEVGDGRPHRDPTSDDDAAPVARRGPGARAHRVGLGASQLEHAVAVALEPLPQRTEPIGVGHDHQCRSRGSDALSDEVAPVARGRPRELG